MTRLSDALKRAAETANTPPITTEDVTPIATAATATTWQFAPVETMHVPDEAAAAPDFSIEELRSSEPAPETITPAVPAKPVVFGAADRSKLVVGEGIDGSLIEQYRHLAAVMHHAQKASN